MYQSIVCVSIPHDVLLFLYYLLSHEITFLLLLPIVYHVSLAIHLSIYMLHY